MFLARSTNKILGTDQTNSNNTVSLEEIIINSNWLINSRKQVSLNVMIWSGLWDEKIVEPFIFDSSVTIVCVEMVPELDIVGGYPK